jgi:MIP family channel proteins
VRPVHEQLAAEFIGTFVFVFIGAGAATLVAVAGGSTLEIAVATGLALAIMISALGHISGGHFNPAVTVGAWVTGKIDTLRAPLYIVAQLAGAAAGAGLLRLCLSKKIWEPSSLGATIISSGAKGAGFTTPKALLLEAVMTFALVLVVFATAIDERGTFKTIAGFGIGLIVSADILVGGPLTGASMNPARSFGPALVVWKWTDFWIYILGPLAGAVIAAEVYWFLFLRPREAETGVEVADEGAVVFAAAEPTEAELEAQAEAEADGEADAPEGEEEPPS